LAHGYGVSELWETTAVARRSQFQSPIAFGSFICCPQPWAAATETLLALVAELIGREWRGKIGDWVTGNPCEHIGEPSWTPPKTIAESVLA
jgi:hypothetical protein